MADYDSQRVLVSLPKTLVERIAPGALASAAEDYEVHDPYDNDERTYFIAGYVGGALGRNLKHVDNRCPSCRAGDGEGECLCAERQLEVVLLEGV